MGDESGFSLVSILDLDIVISPMDIELDENLCPLEFINKVGDEWKRVCITDCVFVNIAVVLTGAETTVFLFNKEERRCLWRI